MFRELKEISADDLRKKVWVEGEITLIKQTSGPTLLMVNDGTGSFTLKAFKAPGVRAYPEIVRGDFVKSHIQISQRNNSVEGEVLEMKKLSSDEKKNFANRIEKMKLKNIQPCVEHFSIESPVLEKLKPRFLKVAKMIRKAVFDGRPILLRHDSDCDGYSSAICMERAILNLIEEVTQGDTMTYYNLYRRAPSKAPFYDYEDAIKDLSIWLRDKTKLGLLPPLIIVTDNGSTREDILAFRQMKVYDCQIVVIDHHFPGAVDEQGKVEVDYIIDGHINPYLEGFDSNVCSAMLGFELANMIYEKNSNSVMIPAMASILDHTTGYERDVYIKKAEEEGFTQEYLENLGEIVYLQSHYLRFSESREFVDEIFGSNSKLQKTLVEILTPELENRYNAVRKIADFYSKIEDYGAFYLVEFDGEKGTSRGQYPAVGKATNKVHLYFEEKLDKPIITMTYGSTFLTIRVSDSIKGFSVPSFCSQWIDVKIPHTSAQGGGHEHAGSVKFVEYAKLEVVELFKEYVKEIAKNQ